METSNQNQQQQQSKIRSLIAPDVERRKELRSTFKEISYYLLIGIISIIIIFVVPLLSGCIQGDFRMNFPTTVEGWIVYWAISGGSTAGNVSIFVLFKLQAKTNSRKHPNFIKACNILSKLNGEEGFVPRSPAQMNAKSYITKITTIVISSLSSFVVVTSLVISFDFVTFLSCLITAVIAIAFGWVTMIKDEEYWTDEYLLYAEYTVKKRMTKESSETSQESVETSTESNVSTSDEELLKDNVKEAENA